MKPAAAEPIGPRCATRGLVVPVLADVHRPSALSGSEEFAAALGIAMLDAGVATAGAWRKGISPSDFVACAFHNWMELHGASRIARRFQLCTQLGSEAMFDPTEPPSVGYLLVSAHGSAYSRLGPVIRAIPPEYPRLAASVAHGLYSLESVFYIYDHVAEHEYREMWMEGVDDEEAEEFARTHPAVILPEPLERRPLSGSSLTRIAHNAYGTLSGSIAAALARINWARRALTAIAPRVDRRADIIDLQDMGAIAPALLLSIEERDQITAAFDDEGQYRWEENPAPSIAWDFPPTRDGVVDVFERLAAVMRLLDECTSLLQLLPGHAKYTFDNRPRLGTSAALANVLMNSPMIGGRLYGTWGSLFEEAA